MNWSRLIPLKLPFTSSYSPLYTAKFVRSFLPGTSDGAGPDAERDFLRRGHDFAEARRMLGRAAAQGRADA